MRRAEFSLAVLEPADFHKRQEDHAPGSFHICLVFSRYNFLVILSMYLLCVVGSHMCKDTALAQRESRPTVSGLTKSTTTTTTLPPLKTIVSPKKERKNQRGNIKTQISQLFKRERKEKEKKNDHNKQALRTFKRFKSQTFSEVLILFQQPVTHLV